MPDQAIFRTVEFKLYPSTSQRQTLTSWLSTACWLYNRCLEQRQKAYRRRKESVSLNDQQRFLVRLRNRIDRVRLLPSHFGRSALRRVDRGMKAFFRRVKAGAKNVGYPRFRSHRRYNSIEHLEPGKFIRDRAVFVPGLGVIRARGRFGVVSTQKLMRVIRRASGWYAQVVVESPTPAPLPSTGAEVGIDLGLESFLTTDAGERVENPRHLRKAAKKLRKARQRLTRCRKGSNGRKQAVKRVARLHQKTARKRHGFCHRLSRSFVNRFDRIAVEDLDIKGLAKGKHAKHVLDACWGFFVYCLTYKAASAGRSVVKVDPAGTSQECPACGRVAPKALSKREHSCSCGFRCHRDHASALVIRQRGLSSASGGPVRPLAREAGPVKLTGSTCS